MSNLPSMRLAETIAHARGLYTANQFHQCVTVCQKVLQGVASVPRMAEHQRFVFPAQATETLGQHAEVLMLQGAAHYHMQMFAESIACSKRAIELNPSLSRE